MFFQNLNLRPRHQIHLTPNLIVIVERSDVELFTIPCLSRLSERRPIFSCSKDA
ncbi:hypothetical protein CPB84DRAFT_1776283, partial [Gymnopilus junonius]